MKKPHLKKVGHVGDNEVYSFTPVGISKRSAANVTTANAEYAENSSTVFDGDGIIQPKTFTRGDKSYKYIPYGPDDRLPYHLIRLVGDNMVMAQNKLFNVLTCYGGGLRFRPVDGQTAVPDALTEFAFRNSLDRFFIEQAMDMKYFFFTVTCIILDRDGKNIVQIRHKESCYCRFEQADDNGRINHVFYANWLKGSVTGDDVEIIPLLDYNDPYGDLRVRLGFDPDPATGECRRPLKTDPAGRPTRDRKFAILTRFPTPGFQYYPVPFYTSIFRDSWYDIYELIGKGKRAKIRNSAPPRFQIEVHKDYWDNLCDQEGITDPVKRKARIALEKRNIEQFITGSANIGKTWITGYYVDPASGKEVRMVRVYDVEGGKTEGGDWSDDIQEASNSICYGDNVHPNLVGATPGKSSMNNSGSDKRELFNLKQLCETAFHDILLQPIRTILWFNDWHRLVDVDVPILMMTTLDKNTEVKEGSAKKE